MENGLNPGLGIRDLHQQGITGKGVSVAVIDQTLFTKHSEYAERLKHYEELNIYTLNGVIRPEALLQEIAGTRLPQ